MNEALISMKDVSKSFKSKHVLKRLNFDLPKGSVVGLLGKNGAGKTTLIKCALGLLRPQSGAITVFGEEVWDLSDQAKGKLGYVPQTSSFYHWMKVGDVIDYTASFYPKWNHDLVNQLLDEWEFTRKEKAVLLSEGQAQQLSIIIALGHDPELLILDEPIASLDPSARRTFLKTIVDAVADRECTVLFSSHITSDVERIADMVAILHAGKMKFSGELAQLKDEVKRLKIRYSDSSPRSLEFPGILQSKSSGDETIVYVQNYNQELKEKIEHNGAAKVSIEDINLEEIFVEITR